MISRTKLAARQTVHPASAGFRQKSARLQIPSGLMLALVLTAIGFAVCSCSKKAATDTPRTTANPSTGAPAPQPLPPSSQTIAADATAEAAAGQLTAELRRYVAYTHSIPKSFEDFAAHDPIKFPPPPSGKKYVIAHGKVVVQ